MRLRKISLIMATIVALSTFTGCSKEKEVVFESDVAINNTSDKKVIQEELKINLPEETRFEPLYYDGGNIIGNLSYKGIVMVGDEGSEEFPISGFHKKNLYVIENNNITDTGIEDSAYPYKQGIKGLTNNYYDLSSEVYYFNRETNEKRKVENIIYGVDNIKNHKVFSDDNYFETDLVQGNDDFGYIISNYKKGDIKKVTLQFIDLKNNKTYLYKKQSEQESFILSIVYSKETDKFYAVKGDGNIYDLDIIDNEVLFNKKAELKVGEISTFYSSYGVNAIQLNKNGEIGIYFDNVFFDESRKDVPLILYNPATNNLQEFYQEQVENFTSVYPIKETNFIVLEKCTQKDPKDNPTMQEYYLGEVNNGKIDIYHKIDIPMEYGQSLYIRNVIANGESSELFMHLTKNQYANDKVEDIYLKLKIQE